MLFPIAALSLIIIYAIEQASFFYSYKAPPMYDGRLSESMLSTMMWAPAFYLAFGYWMVGSRQLYSNKFLTEIENTSSVYTT